MSRLVKIATVQPPAAVNGTTPDSIQLRALELLESACMAGADIICLPEYLNCMACGPEEANFRAGDGARKLMAKTADYAAKYNCYIITPVVIDTDQGRYNRAVVFDRNGQAIDYFNKVHITHLERDEWNITPGDSWPIIECDFGKIGVMICYDGCFMESSRILALQGAEIIFWPSLQRSFTENELVIQIQAHSYFNRVNVVRSSYGTEKGQPWTPGMMVGLSCVCGGDGQILASLGRWVGWTMSEVDMDIPQTGLRSFGGEEGALREMHFADRRPDTYGDIIKNWMVAPYRKIMETMSSLAKPRHKNPRLV